MMTPIFRCATASLLCLVGTLTMTPAVAEIPSPSAFAEQLASEHGIAAERVLDLIQQAERREDILELMRRPAESKPWHEYRNIFLKPERVQAGVQFWQEHEELLDAAAERFDVDPAIIVALLGIETYYGERTGSHRVLDALYTLGFHYPPRADFFRKELAEFIRLSEEESLPATETLGSYAGAMGYGQFIPSSYRAYAVDFNDNGQRDLWDEPADAIGSVANYLARHGWQRGAAIMLPTTGSNDGIDRSDRRPERRVADLEGLGLYCAVPLSADTPMGIVRLEETAGASHWLGLKNFFVITRYNRSPLYAAAAAQLTQALQHEYARAQAE